MFRPLPLISLTFLLCLLMLPQGSLQAQNRTAPRTQTANATESPNATLPSTPVASGEKDRVPIRVTHENTDQLGRQLVFHMRERFSSSELFRLSEESEEKILIRVGSQVEFQGRQGLSSVYAVIWTFSYGRDVLSNYLESDTGIVTKNRVKAEAEDLVARTYEVYNRYSYLMEEGD